jgi:tetratricopeptide (TPR) repeat protein
VGERTSGAEEQPRTRRVFISYAHEPDSDTHSRAVRDLWVFLRSQGIDAHVDLVAAQQRQDWGLWMADQVREADHILVIASPAYRDRAQGQTGSQVGRGVQWEARLIRDAFYRDQQALQRFVPVVLPGQTTDGVPDFLAAATCTVYLVREFTVPGAEALVRLLTGQPALREPPLGLRPTLPTSERTLSGRAPIRRLPRPSEFFVGRSRDLARLSAALVQASGAAIAAVHGLGGVGKSTLVARFAEANTDRYGPVWWITADSPDAVRAGLAELATAVRPGSAALTAEQRVESAVQWLSTSQDWLLVLDNLPGPTAADELLARVHTGTIVITSRLATGWRGLTTLSLDVLPPADAEELLIRTLRADWPDADTSAAARLCEELGWLPLAVAQAGAYLGQARVTPTAYLDLLADYPSDMFAATGEANDSRRTIARIWRVTLDQVADTPLAGDVLRQLAWYAPDDIPRRLVAGLGTAPEVLVALGRLHAYSMITLSAEHIAVHRLVQSVTRTPNASDPHRQPPAIAAARTAAVAALVAEIDSMSPKDPRTWVRYRAVLPHARALLTHAVEEDDSAAIVELANQLAVYLLVHGDHASAVGYLERAVRSGQRLAGGHDETTLTVRANLASTYKALGNLELATSTGRATLADCQRLLGPDHVLSLAVQSNLAHTYSSAGDLARALPAHQTTLAAMERVLGPEHPQTLASRSNLADGYASAGDTATSIRLHESIVDDRTRILGREHPDTLLSCDSLAMVILATGDLTRAMPLLETNLAARQRVLGADHPDTLASGIHLAKALQQTGSLARAIALYEKVLIGRTRVLGPSHSDSLTCRGALAAAYRLAGRLDTAIDMHRQIVDDCERAYGATHPVTLRSLSALAATYSAAGDRRAITAYERLLGDCERVVGHDSRDAYACRHGLGIALGAQGEWARAAALLEITASGLERTLGNDAPDTLKARRSLADAYQSMGDLKRALALHETIVADSERVLGDHHLDTLAARSSLASTYEQVGDLGRAILLHESVLALAERVLDASHPVTFTFRNNVANAYESAGDLARAIPLHEANVADSERVLGSDHPDVLSRRNNLANAHLNAGHLERAKSMGETVLADRERVLGAEHPDTLVSCFVMAQVHAVTGDLERAIRLGVHTLEARRRVIGPDHPDTLLSTHLLASLYALASDFNKSLSLISTAVLGLERVMGAEHRLTTAARAEFEANTAAANRLHPDTRHYLR